jgi:hypothetical protein
MRATVKHAVRLACLLDGSRMSREVPVRFCERPVVKFRRPTHPGFPKERAASLAPPPVRPSQNFPPYQFASDTCG